MNFPSKILLIGEHSILNDSQSLAIPFEAFSGEWKYLNESSEELLDLSNQLDESLIDVSAFKRDCKNGLSFHSTIPRQFGLGSSGALTAAIYHSYAHEIQADTFLLQADLAKIESIFHGKSSGTDALVSYLNASIHTKDKQSIILDKNPLQDFPNYVYLFNAEVKRSAKKYIDEFQNVVHNNIFDIRELCDIVDQTIGRILSDDKSDLWSQLQKLSHFQYTHLPTFIPEPVRLIWNEGLLNDSFYFKLCGAGGGGYFLVFSKRDIFNLYPDRLIRLNSNQ